MRNWGPFWVSGLMFTWRVRELPRPCVWGELVALPAYIFPYFLFFAYLRSWADTPCLFRGMNWAGWDRLWWGRVMLDVRRSNAILSQVVGEERTVPKWKPKAEQVWDRVPEHSGSALPPSFEDSMLGEDLQHPVMRRPKYGVGTLSLGLFLRT